MAKAGLNAKSMNMSGVTKTWGGLELARLVLFVLWWPCELRLADRMYRAERAGNSAVWAVYVYVEAEEEGIGNRQDGRRQNQDVVIVDEMLKEPR